MLTRTSRGEKFSAVTVDRHRRPSTTQPESRVPSQNSSPSEPSQLSHRIASWSSDSTDWSNISAPNYDQSAYMSGPKVRLHLPAGVTPEVSKKRTPSPLALPTISPLRILGRSSPSPGDESSSKANKSPKSNSSLSPKLHSGYPDEESPKARAKRLRENNILDQPLKVAWKRLRSDSLVSSNDNQEGLSNGRSSPTNKSPSRSPRLLPISFSSAPKRNVDVSGCPPLNRSLSIPAPLGDVGICLVAVLETYGMASSTLQARRLDLAPGYLKGFHTCLQERVQEVEAEVPVILHVLAYAQAKKALEFHSELLLCVTDTLNNNLSEPQRTEIVDEASDILDHTWHTFKAYIQVVEHEMERYRLDVFGYKSKPVDEKLARQLMTVATTHQHSSNWKLMKGKLLAYLEIAAGTNSPGNKLTKKRPIRDRSASAPPLPSSGCHLLGYEINSEILNGMAIGSLKVSLRDSLMIMSSAPASYAVEFPRPEAETTEVKRNPNSVVISASLNQWIRMLTDTVEVGEDDYANLLDTFFVFFRQFTTPQALFDALLARYHEEPLPGLDDAQQYAWSRYHQHAKFLVVKMIIWWTQWYWVPAQDKIIAQDLIDFTFNNLAKDQHFRRGLASMIATNMCDNSSEAPDPDSRQTKILQETLKRSALSKPLNYPATGFEESIRQLEDFVRGDITCNHVDPLMFAFPGGAEEIARALTIKESEIFHKILPEEIVNFREGKHPKALVEWMKFSNSISLWPAHEVLRHTTPEKQAQMKMLFIDVAVCCRKLRNFNSAYTLLTGLDLSIFTPLKKMNLLIDEPHRKLVNDLRKFFASGESFYKKEIDETAPAIPLVYRLKNLANSFYHASQSNRPSSPKPSRAGTLAFELNKSIGSSSEVSANPEADRSGTSEFTGSSGSESRKAKMIPIAYYTKMREAVRGIERIYGDYQLPKVNIVYEWVDVHRKPMEVELNEFNALNDKLYKLSCQREPLDQIVGRHNRLETGLNCRTPPH